MAVCCNDEQEEEWSVVFLSLRRMLSVIEETMGLWINKENNIYVIWFSYKLKLGFVPPDLANLNLENATAELIVSLAYPHLHSSDLPRQ